MLHNEVLRIGRVGHEARLVEYGRHAACIAKGAVKALQSGVDKVELVGDVVRIGKHHDKRARRDAKPRVAAAYKDSRHAHNHHGDDGGDDAARKTCPHALAVAGNDLAVGLVKQPALVILAPVGLDGQDVGHTIGKLAGQLVLRAGGLFIEVEDALVEVVGHGRVDDEHDHEDRDKDRHARQQNDAGGHD